MTKFKRIMAAVLLLTLLMTVFASTALAASKVRTTGSCNIRSGPGLGYSSRGTMPSGRTATYLGSRKKDGRGVYWLKIRYNGKTGWVSTKYAYVVGSSYDYDDYDYDDYDSSVRVKASATVNVRSGPGTGYSKIGTLKKGNSLYYRGKVATDYNDNVWFAVYYNGKNGWVISRYTYLK